MVFEGGSTNTRMKKCVVLKKEGVSYKVVQAFDAFQPAVGYLLTKCKAKLDFILVILVLE